MTPEEAAYIREGEILERIAQIAADQSLTPSQRAEDIANLAYIL